MVAYQCYAVPGNSSRFTRLCTTITPSKAADLMPPRPAESREPYARNVLATVLYGGRFSDGCPACCPAFWLRGLKPGQALRSLVKSKRSAMKTAAVITSPISRRGRIRHSGRTTRFFSARGRTDRVARTSSPHGRPADPKAGRPYWPRWCSRLARSLPGSAS